MMSLPLCRVGRPATGMLVAGVALAVLLPACSPGGEARPRPSETSPATAVSKDPHAEAADAALRAYRGMWGAFVVAARTADPTSPGLKRYTTGEALKIIVKSLAADRERGYVSKGEPVLNARITKLTPTDAPRAASVLDCADSSRWLKYKKSGGLVNDVPGGKRKITAQVKLYGDRWKVTSFAVEGLGSC